MLDIRHKFLISGDFGVGKTFRALSYTEHIKEPCCAISLDYERGQDYYVVDDPAQAKPGKLFYCRRVKAPTLYEAWLLLHRIRDPKKPAKEIVIDGAPLDANRISDDVKKISADIAAGKIQPNTLIVDTVTRLCDLTTQRVFNEYIRRMGLERTEKMSQLIWGKAKDELAEFLYTVIDTDVNLIMTAWAKAEYEGQNRTGNVIADVLKNVRAFVDVELMLQANERQTKQTTPTPKARVMKSRLTDLPSGTVLPSATWDAIFNFQPTLEVEDFQPDLAPVMG